MTPWKDGKKQELIREHHNCNGLMLINAVRGKIQLARPNASPVTKSKIQKTALVVLVPEISDEHLTPDARGYLTNFAKKRIAKCYEGFKFANGSYFKPIRDEIRNNGKITMSIA